MYKYLLLISLFLVSSCATVTTNEIPIEALPDELKDIKPNIIEQELTKEPYDIWERIRKDLTLVIPQDQLPFTSIYRERLVNNQNSVNRISKQGQR